MIWLGFIIGAVLAVVMFYHKRKKEDARLKSIIEDATKINADDNQRP